MDLNTVDSIIHHPLLRYEYIDPEVLDEFEESIRRQYIHFENLGVDLLNTIEDQTIKSEILIRMLDYVGDNYFNIPNYENIVSSEELLKIGQKVYKFIVIDLLNNILPNFMNDNKITIIDDFDRLILKYGYDKVVGLIISSITNVNEKLKMLGLIDANILKDEKLQQLLEERIFYCDILNSSKKDLLVENFLRRFINKNLNELLWRMM